MIFIIKQHNEARPVRRLRSTTLTFDMAKAKVRKLWLDDILFLILNLNLLVDISAEAEEPRRLLEHRFPVVQLLGSMRAAAEGAQTAVWDLLDGGSSKF